MTDDVGEVRDAPLAEALGERYLAYALSTIVSRSLPDVRDGLKPVHRRLLYAMRQLRLDPDGGFKKCARVVGDVIGKYHPHGDVAVYDALVRLAQEFAVRYPLVEGQGNFGNIDGDNAAAMRYTEARLTTVAALLMEGLDDDTVDFRPTYDGSEEEPVVMPGAFPNLLANGAAGIAVGMATSIPPHNAAEICDALLHLIDHPDSSIEEMVQRLRGPDFPTGGVLAEDPAAILEAYRTGRGSFRLRARWQVDKLAHGQWRILVTEIPYQVQKSRLIERIAEMMEAKKLSLLGEIRDESAEDVRIVLEPKTRATEPALLMEQLFRDTEMETRVPLNMNLLDAGAVPRVMDVKEVLRAFLDHRHEVLLRRTRHRQDRIAARLEVLDGFLVAYLDLDRVIRIIREEDEPKRALMAAFALTDAQAEAILNMRLRSLRRLEEMELKTEHAKLTAEAADLARLMQDDRGRWRAIAGEVRAVRDQFGPETPLGRRRTELAATPLPAAALPEAEIEREDITVYLSEKGWLRAVRGHVETGGEDARFKEGDALRFSLHANTVDKLLLFASDGRFYTLAGDKLPRGRGFGEPLRLMIDLANDAEPVALLRYDPDGRLLVAGSSGRGFLVAAREALAQTRAGRQVLTPADGDVAAFCLPATGDSVAIVGRNRKLLVFPLAELPEMARGRGVILQKYKEGGIADLKLFTLADGLAFEGQNGKPRLERDLGPWQGRRAGAGRMVPSGFRRDNRFG